MFKSKVKDLTLILSMIVFCGLFSGCYDKREVDDLAYAVGIGFDKGKTDSLKLTLQFAVPLSIGGGGGSSRGGGEGAKSLMISVETPTLYAGLNMVNDSLSKQVNLSHAKVIVFSEELAREGLSRYVHAIVRGREFRPSMYVAVSRGAAEDYLKSIKPLLDPSPAKYYELTYSKNYTGFIESVQFHDFYFSTESYNRQATAVLAGVGKYKDSSEFNTNNSTFKEKGRPFPLEGDFKAGDMPKIGDLKGEVMGSAVFKGDKMVGEIDGEETGYHLMLSNKYNNAYWSIPDPHKKDYFVVLNIKKSKNPIYKVDLIDGKPNIYVKVILEADIESIQSNENYEEKSEILEKAVESFLKEGIIRFLNKTAKEFNCDICGFGKNMQWKFLTWKEWENFKWLDKYKNSTFNVDVDLKIRRPGLIIRSVKPVTVKEGE